MMITKPEPDLDALLLRILPDYERTIAEYDELRVKYERAPPGSFEKALAQADLCEAHALILRIYVASGRRINRLTEEDLINIADAEANDGST